MKIAVLWKILVFWLYSLHIWKIMGQTILYDWDFSEFTTSGTSTWSQYNSSSFSYLYAIKSSNPTQKGNYNSQGYIGEINTSSGWTAVADPSYNTGFVSFTIYVYITDLTTLQYLYCKNLFVGLAVRRGIWVGLYGSNQIFVEVNTDPLLGGNTVQTLTGALTYTLGWNLIGCVSIDNGIDPLTLLPNPATIEWYNVMHDGSTSTSPVFSHTQPFVDNDSYLTWIAVEKTSLSASSNGLLGMVHELTQYSSTFALTDMQGMLQQNWNWPCSSCLTNMEPNWLEYQKTAMIAEWDFAQPIYIDTIYDQGSGGYNFQLLDNQTSFDPIYVNNQGLSFDSNRLIRTSTQWIQSSYYSITVEGWIRPMSSSLEGPLLTFENPAGKTDSSITFNGNNIVVFLKSTSVSIPISAPTVGNWYYIGVSVEKIATSQSRVCAVFGTSTESWVFINNYLNLNTTGDFFQVGARFTGVIKELRILDWPKRDYEFYDMYQTSGWTTFNGVSCSHCPKWTGQWISNCNTNEFGPTCSQWLTPNCNSCYAYDYAQCYSWLGGYAFTYSEQSWIGYCGNGVLEADLNESWDDGNNEDGDGWSSNWAIEPDFT